MKHSVDRILTTHAGSLPRPQELLELVKSGDSNNLEHGANAERLRSAVVEIVRRQAALGIDVIDDGEYGKPSFVSYINERLGGYEVDTRAGPRNQWLTSREGRSFPELYAQTHPASAHTHMILHGPDHLQGSCTAQARYRQPQSGAPGHCRRRGVHARHFAVEHRGLAEERIL
jgi:5-methyltetrahydropteroyltriglutamate--homocysteine methyltransferase